MYMTGHLSEVLERVKTWPVHRQEDAAHVLESMEKAGSGIYHLSSEERRAVQVGLDQAKRGEFVSDEELSAFRNRHNA